MENEFENMNIDEEYYDEEVDEVSFTKDGYFDNHIAGIDIVQLKRNIIPKGLCCGWEIPLRTSIKCFIMHVEMT